MKETALEVDFDNLVSEVVKSSTIEPIKDLEKTVIGFNKYHALKKFNLSDLSDENIDCFHQEFNMPIGTAIKQVAAYEEKYINSTIAKTRDYLKNIYNPPVHKPKQLAKKELWNRFSKAFFENEGCKFVQTPATLENVKTLFYYFLSDEENFLKCKNINLSSQPSLQKGLLVIGDFGCGKSSVFWALEKALKNVKGANFRGFTANQIVSDFERCTNIADKDFFYDMMFKGTRYFDDVKTERVANNYGKADLLKDILETRNRNRARTYITCNYAKGKVGDISSALLEFKTRYGERVYDRLFQDFNIIEFKGDSFRK